MADAEDKTALSEDQFKRGLEWISKYASDFSCVFCRQRQFTLAPHVVTPAIMAPDKSINLAGSSYPFLILTCSTCAATYFFNAVIAGVFEGGDGNKSA